MEPLLITLPNLLSGTRLVLGLVIVWLPAEWRLAILAVAALTDVLDGEASRFFKAQSEFGRLLDPIADKIFLVGFVLALLLEGTLAWWQVVLLAGRDIVVVSGGIWVLVRDGRGCLQKMGSRLAGKITTGLQFLVLVLAVLPLPEAVNVVLIPTAILGLIAGLDYIREYLKCDRISALDKEEKVSSSN
ncbi:MAG: CDP-alcohol phosphatidyltransferase family protein [Bdellovibrionales bacterium]